MYKKKRLSVIVEFLCLSLSFVCFDSGIGVDVFVCFLKSVFLHLRFLDIPFGVNILKYMGIEVLDRIKVFS